MDEISQEIMIDDFGDQKKENEEYIKTLKEVYGHLNNLRFECTAREYILDEYEISRIFYCRDSIYLTLKKYG